MSRRLVLLGGGHAHLFVLEGFIRGEFPAVDAVMVSPVSRQAYSGMVPGMVGGRYAVDELTFDLAALARAGGVELVPGSAARIEPRAQAVRLDDGRRLAYDVLSIATGSGLRGADLPGVREQALFVKPIDAATAIVPALTTAVKAARDGRIRVAVVGGGLAGVELALAVRAQLRVLDAGKSIVTLIEAAPRILPERRSAAREAERALTRNGVTVRAGIAAQGATATTVVLADGSAVPADVLIWATGPTSTDLLRSSGLATDAQGFLLVNDELRSVSDPLVFAAGDAATLEDHPTTPKAGVYAVRQGPVLRNNLAAACRGAGEFRSYAPQRRFLALLNTGDGRAILSYGPLTLTSRWAMELKDRIDRGFMARFQAIAARTAAR